MPEQWALWLFSHAQYDWTTGVSDNGNDWRKFRAVPLSYPLRPLIVYFVLIGVETEGLLDCQGKAGDHFHCTVEPSPGHIQCRVLGAMDLAQLPFGGSLPVLRLRLEDQPPPPSSGSFCDAAGGGGPGWCGEGEVEGEGSPSGTWGWFHFAGRAERDEPKGTSRAIFADFSLIFADSRLFLEKKNI